MGLIKPHRIPDCIQRWFSDYTFRKSTDQKVIYLTFDDGPIPEVTPWVLECLEEYGAKATFFVVGDNVRKYPEVYAQLLERGHVVGNHTFNHLQGWKTKKEDYLKNIDKCQHILNEGDFPERSRPLFRPPHGRMRPSQARILKQHYEIILWDVLSCDYDGSLSKEEILMKSVKLSRNGSVIVFHDSLKSEKNIKFVLPRYLSHFSKKGYKFKTL